MQDIEKQSQTTKNRLRSKIRHKKRILSFRDVGQTEIAE